MQFMLTSKGDLATVLFYLLLIMPHAPAGEYHSPVGYK
jgi:hypothetical protein